MPINDSDPINPAVNPNDGPLFVKCPANEANLRAAKFISFSLVISVISEMLSHENVTRRSRFGIADCFRAP